MPIGGNGLWETYQELAAHRAPGGLGPGSLTWQDLSAWQAVMGLQLTPWEAGVLMAMEKAVLAAGQSPVKPA